MPSTVYASKIDDFHVGRAVIEAQAADQTTYFQTENTKTYFDDGNKTNFLRFTRKAYWTSLN